MTTVLVTGATGNVGSKVVAGLRARGAEPRALVRDARRAAEILGPGVELATGDLSDPATVAVAVKGADAVFLTSGDSPAKVAQESAVIDRAADAGVPRIVKLSAIGARAGSPLALWDWHGQIEDHLRASGVPATVLRAAFFMSNVLMSADSVRQARTFFLPAGAARVAMIDPQDVAAAAAAALLEDGHEGGTYGLTGPEAVTFEQVAADLAAATGEPVAYVDVPDDAAHASLVETGMPEWMATALVALFGRLRDGEHAATTDTVASLTGRAPRHFAAFARDHAGLFR